MVYANDQITSTKQKYSGQLCFLKKMQSRASTLNPLSALKIIKTYNLPNNNEDSLFEKNLQIAHISLMAVQILLSA